MQEVGQFLPLIFLFAIFYFLIIRPQQKQQKEHKAMLEALEKGDKILTNGGLHAEVLKVEEDFIKIKLNDTTVVKLEKSFVTKKVDV
ncbi:MAG: Preprotein translocase subunit YajC (TC 3.A.5.1.1) [uncultured Sulfurovum sp.]|uniref:Sec translocon accessory complex subunit YajC n=1 Tax=uncultured Sulfurovum sp. TaxID=269237 RepID=A0A6S6U128_9BACT|nr:MAG: Preprotein translocase subunit YajC (TC 3.A.5.1.1) [uncultured Sulfurovum sp.]